MLFFCSRMLLFYLLNQIVEILGELKEQTPLI
jgi:hypothetical protein